MLPSQKARAREFNREVPRGLSQFKSGLDLKPRFVFLGVGRAGGRAVVSQVFEPRDQTGVGSGYPFEWWAFGARGVAANHCFGSRKWSGVRVLVVGGGDRW